MIHVIATVALNPGTRDKFLAEFRKLIPHVRAEAGCMEYGPTIDADTDIAIQFKVGADRVVVIEKWETVAALKAHGVAPHMQAYRAKVKDFVRGMELRVLSPA
jgi:quinol monooxygenase YgiN